LALKYSSDSSVRKEYFLVVADRLKIKINITHNFTSMVRGHSNIFAPI
jgi:hypothetical protein